MKVACGEIFPDEFLIALHVTSKQLMVMTSINSTWNLHCGTLKVQYLVCLFLPLEKNSEAVAKTLKLELV